MSYKARIRVLGVTVEYPSVRALNGVSMDVYGGELLGILGPNGAGKTTLLRCLYRAVKPVSGTIYLDGRSLEEYSFSELAREIASAPTEIPPDFNLTVADIIMMGRHPYRRGGFSLWEGEDDVRVVENVSAELGISDLLNRRFSTLSSGQKRRVLIAKALAQEPRILLADEPTANLDLKYQVEVMEILRRVARRGVSVIATFHDLNIASRYCDRVVLMKDGRIFSMGRPAEVLTKPIIEEVYGIKVRVVRGEFGVLVIPR
jgi:iron complex transport system ATP-binding protein